MSATPPVLEAVVPNLLAEFLDRSPEAEEWSPRQVLAHLLFAEREIMRPRLERVAQQDGLLVQPSASAPPPGEAASMLQAWTAARSSNLGWLRVLTPEQRAHASLHPRYGRVTLEEHVVEWAYHDLDHLRQILGVLAADLYPHMGAWQSLYAPPVLHADAR